MEATTSIITSSIKAISEEVIDIYSGVPDGKGKIYDETGNLLFDGIISEGFPVLGILYRLPRISVGRFVIPNRSNYKFIYKKTDLFLKSMKYSSMLQTYTLEGEIHNYAVDVEYICGNFPYHRKLLEGIYYLRSREGKVYIGSMKDSLRFAFGLMLLPNGHSMIGRWSKSRFEGIYRCPPVNQERNPLWNSQLQGAGESVDPKRTTYSKMSVSHYESVRRVSSFNKVPIEVRGNFMIAGDSLSLSDNGRIVFLDGSVYQGEISNNRMSGFGTMNYASGESYSGQWKNNQPNGIGKLNGVNYSFEGQFKNGIWQGFGILTLLAEQKKIKGEWDKGKLRFALIDEVSPNSGMLQIDKMNISVTEESNLFRTGKIELTGICHVLFKERSSAMASLKVNVTKTITPDIHESQRVDSAVGTERQSPDSDAEGVRSQHNHVSQSHTHSPTNLRMSIHSKTQTKPHQFIGVFKRNEWPDIEGFALGQMIAVGFLVRGTEVLFKGISNYEFDRFFGVKYDHETETEYKGHFNGHLKINGYGESLRGETRYIGEFKKNHKSGLVKKTKAGQDIFIAEYEDDKKNGFILKFHTDIPLLAEYSGNTLKRIYYNRN